MLKKLSLILLLTSPCYAVMDDYLGPGTASNANITIASPGAGKRNCLDFVQFNSTASTGGNISYFILDGGTTNYTVTVATITAPSNLVTNPFDSPLPWCGSINRATVLNVTGSSGYQINYIGYVDRVSP